LDVTSIAYFIDLELYPLVLGEKGGKIKDRIFPLLFHHPDLVEVFQKCVHIDGVLVFSNATQNVSENVFQAEQQNNKAQTRILITRYLDPFDYAQSHYLQNGQLLEDSKYCEESCYSMLFL